MNNQTLSQYNPDHDQLESMDTHKNVADMAASKFKNMLNRFMLIVVMMRMKIKKNSWLPASSEKMFNKFFSYASSSTLYSGQ